MHISYLETIRRLVNAEWGAEFKDRDEAEKSLMGDPKNLVAMAILELLGRLNKLGNALKGDDDYDDGDPPPVDEPKDAKKFPGSKVGDIIWAGSIEYGFCDFVVVGKRNDDTLLLVRSHKDHGNTAPVQVATERFFASLSEAIIDRAAEEIKEHAKILSKAKQAEKAAKTGGDLSPFMYDAADESDEEDEEDN